MKLTAIATFQCLRNKHYKAKGKGEGGGEDEWPWGQWAEEYGE